MQTITEIVAQTLVEYKTKIFPASWEVIMSFGSPSTPGHLAERIHLS